MRAAAANAAGPCGVTGGIDGGYATTAARRAADSDVDVPGDRYLWCL
jgi:hypothetical protein